MTIKPIRRRVNDVLMEGRRVIAGDIDLTAEEIQRMIDEGEIVSVLREIARSMASIDPIDLKGREGNLHIDEDWIRRIEKAGRLHLLASRLEYYAAILDMHEDTMPTCIDPIDDDEIEDTIDGILKEAR